MKKQDASCCPVLVQNLVGSAHVKAGWVPVCWAEDAGSWWGGQLHDEALWNWL